MQLASLISSPIGLGEIRRFWATKEELNKLFGEEWELSFTWGPFRVRILEICEPEFYVELLKYQF